MTEQIITSPEGSDQTPRKIRGMFGAISPTYDRLNRLLSGRRDCHWRRVTARRVVDGLAPCARVLDVATGTGDLARELDRAARREQRRRGETAGIEIVGSDFTRGMLTHAREKFLATDYRWAEGDGLNLPFASESFDAATVAFGLRNMVDRTRALAEMTRVVRPGGRVAILEFSQPRMPVFGWFYDLYSFRIMPRLGAWISGSDAYLYLAESIRAFWSPEELSEQMRNVGLREIDARPMMFGVVYLHIGTKA